MANKRLQVKIIRSGKLAICQGPNERIIDKANQSCT